MATLRHKLNEHSPKPKYSLVISSPREIISKGIQDSLAIGNGIAVVGIARNLTETLSILKNKSPNVALIDFSVRDGFSFNDLMEIKNQHSNIPYLVISEHDEKFYAGRCLKAGALGYISLSSAAQKLNEAVLALAQGKSYYSPSLQNQIILSYTKAVRNQSMFPEDRLTKSELEVYQLRGEGFSTNKIAERLKLSKRTIEAYFDNIKEKCNIGNSVELTHSATLWVANFHNNQESASTAA